MGRNADTLQVLLLKREDLMEDLSNWNGCPRPDGRVLEGHFVRLEKLDAKKHGDGLFAASSMCDADDRFRWLFEYPPQSREEFQAWMEKVEASEDPYFYAVIDKQTEKVAGRQTLMRIDPAHGVVEIGNIMWSALIAQTPATTEAFFLFAKHIFEDLGYRRFEWKCNNRNEPSKRAALRYGMQAEGVFRQALVVKGENRDTAWFSMLDKEWSVCKAAFEAWLSPENFDGAGKQIARLAELRQPFSTD